MGKLGKKKSAATQAQAGGECSWKAVEISDEFLLGLSEPGFQELEILEPGDWKFPAGPVAAVSSEAEGTEKKAQEKRAKKKKKTLKRARDSKDLSLETSTKVKKGERLGLSSLPSDNGAHGDDEVVAATVQQVQQDMAAWDDYGLDALLVNSLAQLRFTSPTDIQHECLPAAIQGNADMIAAAQTGSGKTLAFALPIINFLVKEALSKAEETANGGDTPASRTALRALVLCPTRELALQVAKDMTSVARALCIRVVALVGGISPQKQARLLAYRPPIVVATPGRLWDLMQSGAEHLADLRYLNFFVLDEADRMVAQGHYEELTQILARIPKPRREACSSAAQNMRDVQASAEGFVTSVGGAAGDELTSSEQVLLGTLRTYVFSATLALPAQVKARLQHGGAGSRGSRAGASLEALMQRLSFRGKPKVADLTTDRKVADNVVESFVSCVPEERDAMLYYLLRMHPGRTLVFLNAISGVRRVAALLKALDINVQVLHAQQQQRQRMKALARFQSGSCAVLVATDVAARGLHIPDVEMVVQYQLPPTADTYIHRAGRTARAGAEGVCVSVVVPQESERFSRLHAALGQTAPQQFPVDSNVLRALRAHTKLAQRIDDLERVNSKANADLNWMQRQSEAIEIDLDEDASTPAGHPGGKGGADAQLAKRLRGELATLIAQPLKGLIQSTSAQSDTQKKTASSKEIAPSAGPVGPRVVQKGSRAIPKTLAQQQAHALQKAVHEKRMKKHGKLKKKAHPHTTSMSTGRISALKLLQRGALSISTD